MEGGPEGGADEEGLGEEVVAGCGEGAGFGDPEELAQRFGDEVGFFVEGGGVLVEDAGDGGGGAVEEVVGGGGVGGAAAVAGEVFGSGDAAVGLVEGEALEARGRVGIGVGVDAAEEAVLAIHVEVEGGPELAGELDIAGPAEVADAGVEEGEVHVAGGAGKIAQGVEEGVFAGAVGAGVGGAGEGGVGVFGCGEGGEVLAFDPEAEVVAHAVVGAEGVEGAGAAPSGEGGAGADGSLHEAAVGLVPERVGGVDESGRGGVEEGVGCGDVELRGEGGELPSAEVERGGGIGRRERLRGRWCPFVVGGAADEDVEPGAVGVAGGVERYGADEDGLWGVFGGLLEGLPAGVPCRCVGEVETGSGRKEELEAGGLAGQLGGGAVEDVTVLVTIARSELEEAADGLDLAADVAAAMSFASACATEGPGEVEVGRSFTGVYGEMEACAGALGEEVKVDGSAAEEGIADGVEHLAGDVAGDDVLGFEEPF